MNQNEMHINALMEKIEKLEAENELLKGQVKFGVDSFNTLTEANARYREALEFTTDMLKASQIWVTSYGVRHDSEKAIQKANEALKEE